MNPTALNTIKWIGTAAGVSGAMLMALNLGIVGYGFALFLVSSSLWLAAAMAQRDTSLVVFQGTFTAINVLGLWRWMGS